MILQNNHYDSPKTLGDILIQCYSISYMEKNYYPDEFYRNTVIICCERKDVPLIYEAISLFFFLKSERYIVNKELIKQDIIGEKWGTVSMDDARANQCEMRFFNFYPEDLWPILDSQFLATNALIDLKKGKFKTIEERRNKKNLRAAYAGIIAALVIGFKDSIKDIGYFIWHFILNLFCTC